ncbi:MAG: family transporter [Panacagrimonas sp.]|jgi:drug/metabolite transporter (DMT)-like permease|nr:family transporter [Panacagrimonas sp.]
MVAGPGSLTGILLFVGGLFLFACMDTTVKFLVAHYPVPVVAAMRYMVHALLMLVLLGPTQGRLLIKTERTGWVLVRAACLAGATFFMGLALQRMPVAETTAIVFLSPLVVVLIAGPVLKEKVGALDWVAALAGFLGIVLIARPGGDLDIVGIAFALVAVAVMVGYQLLSRILVTTERTVAMLFYAAMFGSVLFGLTLPWFWEGPLPPWEHQLLFLLVGACGGMGHFLFTAAYHQTEASALAPLMYAQLLWAGLLGWLVFGHVPDALSILGMLIVAGCGGLVGLKQHTVRRRQARLKAEAEAQLDTEP